MMTPAALLGTNPNNIAAEWERPTAPPEAASLAYADFAAALKDALRDFHSPDLLARNPLLRSGIGTLGGSAGPQELKALLSETVGTLFGNPRDEKLRRVTRTDLFPTRPEAGGRGGSAFSFVRDLPPPPWHRARSFGTLAMGELARAPTQPELPAAAVPTATGEKPGRRDGNLARSRRARGAAAFSCDLPFVNIGGSAEDDPFVDGITETLTTDLSRCSGVFAISRSTAFAYKGKAIDARQIGHELGVRYVLEGSVQNVSGRIRFNAQLVDAESGGHLWAERFDKQRGDLLDMQDEVTTRLARTIHIEMIAAESRRAAREHPDHLDAVDHTLLGWAAWNRHLSLEAARRARRFFEAAFRLDEHNVGALIGFANAHMWEVNMSRIRRPCSDRSARPRQLRRRRWRWPRTAPRRM